MTGLRSCGAVAVALMLLTGCGASPSPAKETATRFTAAVAQARWRQACGLLTPRTRYELEQSAGSKCPKALSDEDLPRAGDVRGSSRFGTMAQVRFRGDTVFVARFGKVWRVSAAGCRKVPDHPYDCTLEG